MHIDPLRQYELVWRISLQKPRLDGQIRVFGYVGLPLVSFSTCDVKKGRLSDETNGCLHPSFSYIKFIMFGLTHFVSIV